MACYNCRTCGFDSQAAWNGRLKCPRCGNTTNVGVAMTGSELAAADLPSPARLPADDRQWAERIDPSSSVIGLARDIARRTIGGVLAMPPRSRPELAILPKSIDLG